MNESWSVGRRICPKWHKALERWYARIDGHMYYLTSKNGTEEEAQQKLEQLVLKLGVPDKAYPDGTPSRPLTPLVRHYLDATGSQVCPKYRHARESVLGDLTGCLGEKPVKDVKPDDIRQWMDTHQTWGNCYRVLAYKIVSAFFNYGIDQWDLQSNPVRRIKGKEQPTTRSDEVVMTQDEFDSLLEHAGKPYRGLLSVLWWSGCRPSEALNATADDYKPAKGTLEPARHKNRKRGKGRIIVLNDIALAIVEEAVKAYPDGPLFPSVLGNVIDPTTLNSEIKRAALRAGIGHKVCSYGLRHSFAHRLYEQDVEIAKIASLMDDNIRTVERHYLHGKLNVEQWRSLLNPK